jgi:hypothetical protein
MDVHGAVIPANVPRVAAAKVEEGDDDAAMARRMQADFDREAATANPVQTLER